MYVSDWVGMKAHPSVQSKVTAVNCRGIRGRTVNVGKCDSPIALTSDPTLRRFTSQFDNEVRAHYHPFHPQYHSFHPSPTCPVRFLKACAALKTLFSIHKNTEAVLQRPPQSGKMLVDRDHGVGVHHRGLHLFEVTVIMTFFSAALLGIRLQQRWGWGRPYGYDDLAATFAAVGSCVPVAQMVRAFEPCSLHPRESQSPLIMLPRRLLSSWVSLPVLVSTNPPNPQALVWYLSSPVLQVSGMGTACTKASSLHMMNVKLLW